MEGQFDRLLSREELRAFDDALGGSARSRPISAYQQRAWLAQQQRPDAVMRRGLALRLTGRIDVERLQTAAYQLVRATPELSARYRFSDDGDLCKLHGDERDCVELVRASSQRDALAYILAAQATPWDAETDPPFKSLIAVCEGEVVLALLPHRILDEVCPLEVILRSLARAYEGRASAAIAAHAVANLDGPVPVTWMHRSGAQVRVLSLEHATELGSRRVSVVVPSASFADVSFASIAARFARFVCVEGGHDEVALIASEDQLGDPSLPLYECVRLRVKRDASERDVATRIVGRVSAKDLSGLPMAVVTRMNDPARFFSLSDIAVERLPLTTCEDLPGFVLAVAIDAQRSVTLELAVGASVSRHAAPLLLERFVAFLASEEKVLPCETAAESFAPLVLAEFRAALAAPQLGPHDDFFDHGGHSLVATRIIGRLLTQHGIELQLNDLFSHPTAASLATRARLSSPGRERSKIEQTSDSLVAPLSLAQQSLWKAYAAFGFGEIFNIPFALEFLDELDEQVFQRAFSDLLERHPGLRTLFVVEGDRVLQRVVPLAELPRYKWFWSSEESVGVDRQREAGHRFELARELPLRLRFLRQASGRQVLSFLFHHIVLDEWSVNLLMDELGVAYRARSVGEAPTWHTEPPPFHEFARQQAQRGVDDAHLAYWTDMLRGSTKQLPNLAGAPASDASSPAGGWVELKLESSTCEGLYALAKQNGASLFNVVYAAIAASMQDPREAADLVIGTSASGRTDPAFFDTVGYFTTVVAHRLRFTSALTVGELITSIKDAINGSMQHSDIPIDLIEEALGMAPGREHLFDLFIQIHAQNKLNGALESADGKKIEFRQLDPDKHESLLGLQFEVMEETIGAERSIRLLMSYRADRYGPAQVEALRERTRRTLESFARADASRTPLRALEA